MQRLLYRHRDYCGVLRYDPNTGLFRWLVARNRRAGRIRPGDIAGTLKDGYVQIIVTVNGKREQWRAHRLAWLLMTGELIKEVGHNEGQRDDNRWDHLSDVTRSQNMLNPTNAPRSDNRSGKTGVSWRADTSKWHARITIEGRTTLLGDFVEYADAVAARERAEEAL